MRSARLKIESEGVGSVGDRVGRAVVRGNGGEVRRQSKREGKGAKSTGSPSKNEEREVLGGGKCSFGGWGGVGRLGGGIRRRGRAGGDCVCLAGRKRKPPATDFDVSPPRVSPKREPTSGQTRLDHPRKGVKIRPSQRRSCEHFGTSPDGARTYPEKDENPPTKTQGLMQNRRGGFRKVPRNRVRGKREADTPQS